jgi:hypothetical protein
MADHSNYPVRLFSYGTLQLPSVQLATFGRRLDGVCDALCGYRVDTIEIVDAEVTRTSGSDFHSILVATSNPSDLVEGMVFSISEAELLNADDYGVDDYQRVVHPLSKPGYTSPLAIQKSGNLLAASLLVGMIAGAHQWATGGLLKTDR